MVICEKCEAILDPIDPSAVKKVLCTNCVRKGALAGSFPEDSPQEVIEKVIKKNQKPVKVKLDMGYVWHEKTWWLDIKATLPDGSPFNIGISRRDLEMHLKEMDGLKGPDETPPAG